MCGGDDCTHDGGLRRGWRYGSKGFLPTELLPAAPTEPTEPTERHRAQPPPPPPPPPMPEQPQPHAVALGICCSCDNISNGGESWFGCSRKVGPGEDHDEDGYCPNMTCPECVKYFKLPTDNDDDMFCLPCCGHDFVDWKRRNKVRKEHLDRKRRNIRDKLAKQNYKPITESSDGSPSAAAGAENGSTMAAAAADSRRHNVAPTPHHVRVSSPTSALNPRRLAERNKRPSIRPTSTRPPSSHMETIDEAPDSGRKSETGVHPSTSKPMKPIAEETQIHIDAIIKEFRSTDEDAKLQILSQLFGDLAVAQAMNKHSRTIMSSMQDVLVESEQQESADDGDDNEAEQGENEMVLSDSDAEGENETAVATATTTDSVQSIVDLTGAGNITGRSHLGSAPIFSQAIYNKQPVDWSKGPCWEPVDNRAFRTPGQDDSVQSRINENWRMNNAKRRIVHSITRSGMNGSQQRKAVLAALCDPDVRGIMSSLGVNLKDVNATQEIMYNMRRIIGRAQKRTDPKGRGRISDQRSNLVEAVVRAAVPSPSRRANSQLSMRRLTKSLGLSSYGAGQRLIKMALEKRAQIAEDNSIGWDSTVHEDRTKYTGEFMDKLEHWVENNRHVYSSPCKNDLLYKRDRDGEPV